MDVALSQADVVGEVRGALPMLGERSVDRGALVSFLVLDRREQCEHFPAQHLFGKAIAA